jgi:hypothetical protein
MTIVYYFATSLGPQCQPALKHSCHGVYAFVRAFTRTVGKNLGFALPLWHLHRGLRSMQYVNYV